MTAQYMVFLGARCIHCGASVFEDGDGRGEIPSGPWDARTSSVQWVLAKPGDCCDLARALPHVRVTARVQRRVE